LVDNFVVHRAAKQWMRMAHERSEGHTGAFDRLPEDRFQKPGWPFQK
jgi:hypothetical protein